MVKPFTVREFMAATPVTFKPDTNVLDAISMLIKHRIAGGPVIDAQGNVVGVLSERDCLRVTVTASYHGDWGGPVSEYMSREVKSVDPDMGLVELAERFLAEPYRRYPVVEDNRLIGLISRRDVLRGLLEIKQTPNPIPDQRHDS